MALIGNYQKLRWYKDEKLVILYPKKKIDVMDEPLTPNQIANVTTTDPLSRGSTHAHRHESKDH